MIEARRVDHNTYDLFIGTQWGDWVRVKKGRSSVYRLAGMHVEKALLKWLFDVLHPTMPITYGQDLDTMIVNNNAIGA